MKNFIYLLFVAGLLMTGCDSRKNFEPKQAYSSAAAISTHGLNVRKVGRDGVTFQDGSFVTRSGRGNIKLPDGFYFINQSSRYVLAANDTSEILILGKSSGKVIKRDTLSFPLVSGAVYGNNIIYMLHNDVFGIYNITKGKSSVNAKVGQAFAIDTRVTNPVTLSGGRLMAVPTLDGKLLIINPKNPRGAQGISIGSENVFNNVIYLSSYGRNRIIAATPRKLVSAAPGSNHKFEAYIADVAISGSSVYALTQDGRVVKLTATMKVLAEKRFKFAQFLSLAVVGGKVYALDKQGSLVVLDSSLKKSKIYNVGEVENYTFVSGSKMYIDDKVVNLTKLPL